MNRFHLLIATSFGVGNFPLAPGTLTSLIVTAVVYFLFPVIHIWGLLTASLLLFILGIPAAAAAEVHFRKKDPTQCVIDEVVAQCLILALTPHVWTYYLIAFFLFRFFDIFKPFPIRLFERIPGGLGIMLDDIAAAAYSVFFLKLILLLT